jgi:glycosyltransferase involved in cell wall biosynthesis
MRIGVMPVLRGEGGGSYQYCLACLEALRAWHQAGAPHEFVIFTRQVTHPVVRKLRHTGWRVRSPQPPRPLDRLRAWVGEGAHRDLWRWLRRRTQTNTGQEFNADQAVATVAPPPDTIRYQPELRRWFERCGVDLMLYPTPDSTSFEVGIPYVIAVHDLQHRLQPEFPEVSAGDRWAWREYTFRNVCRHATLILADSEVGKEDVLNCYGEFGVPADRVKVLPYLPASYLPRAVSATDMDRVKQQLGLPARYFFYPAQFWPHKNHVRIVEALGLLKQRGPTAHIVFCGTTAGGEFREQIHQAVLKEADQLGIGSQIHCLGYVSAEHMAALYAGAVALVMPTFFGPTNIPPLEAWSLGCPVVTSDIRGIREQMGDAALLVDPRSATAIADALQRLWMDTGLRDSLIERGRRRLAQYTPADHQARLIAYLKEAVTRVQQGVAPAVLPLTPH